MNRILRRLKSLFQRKWNVSKKSIVIAPNLRISIYEDIARDFLPRICDMPWEDCWISDYSSLWDFFWLTDREAVFDRIESWYGIDVRDIEDGNLLRIFDRLY